MTGRILVTGATGAELVRRLASAGHATCALIRDTAKRGKLPVDGVEIAPGSFDDSASLAQAMTGIDVLVLITPAAANAHEMATEAIAAAEAAGVEKIVRLSALQADENGLTDNTRQHARTEKRLHQSDLLRRWAYAGDFDRSSRTYVAAGRRGRASRCAGRRGPAPRRGPVSQRSRHQSRRSAL